MPTAPAKPASKSSGRDQALYQAILQEAAVGGTALMGKMVDAARQALQNQEAGLRDPREREAVATAANQLRRCEQQLCSRYPEALQKAFASPEGGRKTAVLSVADVQFDQLELMDDTQVLTSVTLARLQQTALQAAGGHLAELNTLVCSVQGMGTVRTEHNPLRPESYVNALKDVVEQTQVPTSVQLLWFNAMAATLGPELRARYAAACGQLRQQGVVPVAYASPAGFGSHGGATGARDSQRKGSGRQDPEAALQTAPAPLSEETAQPARIRVRGRDEALLTLDKLRRLLSGELNPFPQIGRVEQFAAQFAQQFESGGPGVGQGGAGDEARQGPRTDFDATVPAALEALTEMKQVERVLQSLEQRRGAAHGLQSPQPASIEGQRLALRRSVRDIAQALSLEVVTLMVDNMARDPRLLEPVRQVIRNLEPPLLRLALVDPRFFTDKQHPARRLLHELTHRSLAFESSAASGFDSFLQDLQAALAPLFQLPIENADVFDAKLEALRLQWSRDTQAHQSERDLAVDVLQHAEARNLLAEKIARSIVTHPDSVKVPSVVIDFLCGPWAQVVAQARIKQGSGSVAAERFEALVPALLWSAHPELARSSPAKLTRVVPRLLATLREGLETIHYPATRTSLFLEALMAIHQKVFRAETTRSGEVAADASLPDVALPDRVQPVLDGDPWIAPEEARASNFVELQDSPGDPAPTDAPLAADLLGSSGLEIISDSDFSLGSWVELWTNGVWQRTQLTWASPHGTLFLFTGVFGTTQSMTRRSRDKLMATGRLRLVSGQAVDEEALDAVAQTAMRNSVDSVL
jgi:hypothetical protein